MPDFLRSHRQLPLSLPATVLVAAPLTLWGSIRGQHGLIRVEQSVDGGSSWAPLGSTTIERDGRYRLTVRFRVQGQVRVRLRYPNGDTAVGTSHVA